MTVTDVGQRVRPGRLGDSPARPDGIAKVTGTVRVLQ